MGWSSRAGEIGASGWLGRSVAIIFVLAMAAPSPAQAQRPAPTSTPVPLPNSEISATAGLADLGSNFLERLGDQSTGGFGRAWRSNRRRRLQSRKERRYVTGGLQVLTSVPSIALIKQM